MVILKFLENIEGEVDPLVSSKLRLCSCQRIFASESLRFWSIDRVFKGFICSNSIHILSLLWSHSCKNDTWSLTEAKWLFVALNISWIVQCQKHLLVLSFEVFIANHTQVQCSRINRSILKSIWKNEVPILKTSRTDPIPKCCNKNHYKLAFWKMIDEHLQINTIKCKMVHQMVLICKMFLNLWSYSIDVLYYYFKTKLDTFL